MFWEINAVGDGILQSVGNLWVNLIPGFIHFQQSFVRVASTTICLSFNLFNWFSILNEHKTSYNLHKFINNFYLNWFLLSYNKFMPISIK